MISRILKSTAGKPCSCPAGKKCEGCKKKQIVKPQVFIEEPRRLPIPIVITRYQEKEKEPKSLVKKPTLLQWYSERKALNELKRDYQKREKQEEQEKREKQEKKERERLEKAKREREVEVLEYLSLQSETPRFPRKSKEQKVVKTKHVKARTTSAKPRADSKFVSVKQYNRDSLSTRFVNCCYRICCQFYCYLSCIFIIGFVLIYFL